MNKKRSVKVGIVVVIALLAVGFAAVTTTLFFKGSAVIGNGNNSDDANFQNNIIFASAQLSHNDKDIVGANITKTNVEADTLVFNIPDVMSEEGDEYVLTYTVKNNSQYDAKLGDLTIKMTSDNTKVNPDDYLTVVAVNKNAGTIVEKNGTSPEDTVVVTLKKHYDGELNGEKLGPVTVTITGKIIAEPQGQE